MSKIDAQRAMREAKYARINASGPSRREAAAVKAAASGGSSAEAVTSATPDAPATPTPTPTPSTKSPRARKSASSPKPAPTSTTAPAPKAASTEAAPDGERCGHKSMNGRACTRDAGHSEKSHRYG